MSKAEGPRDYLEAGGSSYPEVDIDIATAAEFTVSHLKCYSHPVIDMQELVEAFARVCT